MKSKIKDFSKFLLEEITIKGNPGIPGEGDKKPGESEYLSDVEKRAKEKLGLTDRDMSTMTPRGPMPSQTEMRLCQRLMQLLGTSNDFVSGKEKQLSQLATVVFMSIYKDIVDRYDIELDIKIIEPGKVKQWMDDAEEDEDEEAMEEFREVTEEDIRLEVHKRKIANLVIQGEAKNTKHILHSEEIKEGISEIYGDESDEIFKVWDELTKIADKLDWIIPADIRSDMMERFSDGLAGASSVGWKPKEIQETEEEDEDEDDYEWTGDEDEDDMYSDEDDSPMEQLGQTPILRARGVDLPMLLHEAVKGLFEILSLGGIPDDKRTAKIALSETGIEDESEDWKYGPEIASDLRDFVNKNPNISKYPNLREELYKHMIDKNTMPTEEFLELFRGILSNTPEARRKVDRMINTVIQNMGEYTQYLKDMEEYEIQMREWEKYQKEGPQPQNDEDDEDDEDFTSGNSGEVDYADLSPSELQQEIDDALEDRDYDKVKMLSKYLKKESKEIYLKEMEMILGKKNRHNF